MQKRDYPILEHDPTRKALIEPPEYIASRPDMPERVVLCFFQDVLTRIFEREDVTHLQNPGSEIGKNPVHVIVHDETPVALVHPG